MRWRGFVRFPGCLFAMTLSGLTTLAHAQLPDAPAPPAQSAPAAGAPAPAAAAPAPGTVSVGAAASPDGSGVPPAPPAGYENRPTYPALSPPPDPGEAPPESSGYNNYARASSSVRIPTRIAARLRALEADLNLLAARGGGRVADGVISLVAGGAFFTIAFFIDDPLFRSLLFMSSGVAVGRGVIDLALVPDPDEYAIQYSHMPMTTVEQVRERLGYGERSLELVAKRSRLARSLDGSIAVVSGAVTIGVFTASPPCPTSTPDCRFKDDPLNYIIIVGGGISIIGGLVGLIAKSEAERRWDAYVKLRTRLRDQDGPSARPLELALPSVRPMPGGAAVTWGMRF